MSTTSFLLLSLLCLGVTKANVLEYRASDGSEFYAKSFVDVLRNAIEHKELGHLAAVFADDFLFVGCNKNYNKQEVLGMLTKIPSDAKVNIEFQSSHFVGEKKIEYTVSVSGLGVSIEANFVIDATSGSWKLVGGNVPSCPKARFFAFPTDAESIAKSFLTHFKIDLLRGNVRKIAKRFSENFLFHGCKGDYTKQKVLALLASIPKVSPRSMIFKSAEFVGDNIQYTVVVSGFGVPDFDAQFILQKENGDYVLIGGKVPTCAASHFGALAASDGSEVIAEAFLGSLTRLIAAQDKTKLAALFSDSFLFHGCKGDYNKQKVLGLLSRLPADTKFSITFQSSQWVSANADIQYTVLASGFGVPDFQAQFVLHQESGSYVLIGGQIPKCPKRHLFAIETAAETIAKSYLLFLKMDLASGDKTKIAKRFSDSFLFHGCKGDYTKEKILALFGSVPKNAKMTFKSADFVNGDVHYTVVAEGFGVPTFEAQFVLHQENGDYVLIGGKVPKCVTRHFNALAASDGSEVIAEAFLGSLTRLIAAQDKTKLAALFSDSFLFHGCKGDYNKQKVLGLLSRLPADTKFSITFQSSQWVSANADIIYTVLASGFGVPDFQAQFVLHQESGSYVLIGGKIPKCARRSPFY